MESWTFDGMATDHQARTHYPYHLSMVHDPRTGDYSLAWTDPSGTRHINIVAGSPDAVLLTSLFQVPRIEPRPAPDR